MKAKNKIISSISNSEFISESILFGTAAIITSNQQDNGVKTLFIGTPLLTIEVNGMKISARVANGSYHQFLISDSGIFTKIG